MKRRLDRFGQISAKSMKIVLILCFSLALSACFKQASPPQNGNTLRLTIGAAPETLDPHLVTSTSGLDVIAALSENLLSTNPKTLALEPATAERWEVLDGGLRYRLYLRPDARWSNGEHVTAQDFVYSWRRLLAPALGNEFATDYYAIENAELYHTGKLRPPATLGVVAITDHILDIRLSRLDPVFLKRLSNGLTAPVHKATVEKFGSMDDATTQWTNAGNFVGNGPFILSKWEVNKVIRVRKNPNYWDKKNIYLDFIDFYPTDTESAEERLYRAGDVDLVFGRRIPVDKIAKYRNEKPNEFFSVVDYATYLYYFNTTRAPFDDVNVRKAFSFSVDRDVITRRITLNQELPAAALTPVSKAYRPPTIATYDPVAAKEYLAKAGYPDGKGFPSVKLLYNTTDTHRKIAVALQQMWKMVLNVDVSLESQEWKVFLTSRKNMDYDIARVTTIGLLADPIDFLAMFTTGHGSNDTGWGNPSYDAMIKKSNVQLDQTLRFETLFKAETILLNEMPIMPIYYYRSSYLMSPKVKGFEFNMLGQPNYKGVHIE